MRNGESVAFGASGRFAGGLFVGTAVLINSAAYSVREGYEKLDTAILNVTCAVNLRAMVLLCVGFVRRYPGEP